MVKREATLSLVKGSVKSLLMEYMQGLPRVKRIALQSVITRSDPCGMFGRKQEVNYIERLASRATYEFESKRCPKHSFLCDCSGSNSRSNRCIWAWMCFKKICLIWFKSCIQLDILLLGWLGRKRWLQKRGLLRRQLGHVHNLVQLSNPHKNSSCHFPFRIENIYEMWSNNLETRGSDLRLVCIVFFRGSDSEEAEALTHIVWISTTSILKG